MLNTDQLLFAKAIADDTRMEIMGHLCCVWLSVNDVVDKLDGKVNQPTVSHHMKILFDTGLVTRQKRGLWVWYRIVPARLDALRAVLR